MSVSPLSFFVHLNHGLPKQGNLCYLMLRKISWTTSPMTLTTHFWSICCMPSNTIGIKEITIKKSLCPKMLIMVQLGRQTYISSYSEYKCALFGFKQTGHMKEFPVLFWLWACLRLDNQNAHPPHSALLSEEPRGLCPTLTFSTPTPTAGRRRAHDLWPCTISVTSFASALKGWSSRDRARCSLYCPHIRCPPWGYLWAPLDFLLSAATYNALSWLVKKETLYVSPYQWMVHNLEQKEEWFSSQDLTQERTNLHLLLCLQGEKMHWRWFNESRSLKLSPKSFIYFLKV